MPDIDVSKIKPGDTVRVRLHTHSMEKAGVDPIEFTTKAYAPGHPDYSALCIAGFGLAHPDYSVLEHIPARPDWADALVVRDKDGDLWGRNRNATFRVIAADSGGLCLSASEVAELSPITVVLDADGNPPAPEWLDADALDKLPVGSLVKDSKGGPATPPREKVWPSDGWHMLGSPPGPGLPSSQIAPARVLWTPDADR